MASMQCYRSCSETCESHRDNSSFGHKVTDMVGKVFHGNNHQAYPNHPHNHNHNQSLYPGQTLPAHQHHHSNQSLYHGQTPQNHHYPTGPQMGQYGNGGLTLTHGATGGHGMHGHNDACSAECGNTHGRRSMRLKNRSHSHSHCNNNKHRDGNRSCSDDSGSDSD